MNVSLKEQEATLQTHIRRLRYLHFQIFQIKTKLCIYTTVEFLYISSAIKGKGILYFSCVVKYKTNWNICVYVPIHTLSQQPETVNCFITDLHLKYETLRWRGCIGFTGCHFSCVQTHIYTLTKVVQALNRNVSYALLAAARYLRNVRIWNLFIWRRGYPETAKSK